MIFDLDGLSIDVVAPVEHIIWLAELCSLTSGTAPPSLRVNLSFDAQAHTTGRLLGPLAPAGPAFIAAGRAYAISTLPRWQLGGEDLAWHPQIEVLFRVSGKTIDVIAADVGAGRDGLMRVVRELHERWLLAQGGRLLHAASVAIDGGAVLVAGARESGKTTLMTYLLTQGGAGFMSNDRTVLMPDGRAIAMPAVVSVRPGTFDHLRSLPSLPPWTGVEIPHRFTLAELARMNVVPRKKDLVLSGAQLCAWLKIPQLRVATARAILYPEIVRDRPPPAPQLERLGSELRPEANVDVHPIGLLAALFRSGSPPPFTLPAFRCRLGAYPQGGARSLLEAAIQ